MEKFDVVIAGGGVGGISAAISSAKQGLKVCLIEKSALLGGLATIGLINWFEPLCDGKGRQVLFSNVKLLFDLALSSSYSTLDKNWKQNNKRLSSWFNHNLFALKLNKLLSDLGVYIYYESTVGEVILNKDKNLIDHLNIFTIEGKISIYGNSYIDATGSAYLFKQAGLKTRDGLNYLTYAVTTYKDGLDKPKFFYFGAGYNGNGHPNKIQLFKQMNQNEVNRYIKQGQNYCLEEYLKGNGYDLSILPSMNQFRKISTIIGDYQLSKDDLFKHHEDSVGVIGVFNKAGEWYELPKRILTNKNICNLFASGRIISCLDDDAWEAIRVIPSAIASGEAAGLLAYLYKINRLDDTKLLQKILQNNGVLLHY